jgi:hypothetical protein
MTAYERLHAEQLQEYERVAGFEEVMEWVAEWRETQAEAMTAEEWVTSAERAARDRIVFVGCNFCLEDPDVAELYGLLYERRVVVWNASYDRMVFDYAASGYMHESPDLAPWECAMQRYAEYAGDWNEEKQSYRWHRLESGDHSALGDCKATLRTIREMAGIPAREEM